jgi:hypothetical protein
MAWAMASALRVKNTAYFDIAADPFHQRVPGIAESPAGWRLVARDATDKQQGQSAAMPARERRGLGEPGE